MHDVFEFHKNKILIFNNIEAKDCGPSTIPHRMKDEVNKHLRKSGITLIGSGLDEAPMVYKDIHQVMAYQKDLVEVVGKFTPKVVRMCGEERFQEVD